MKYTESKWSVCRRNLVVIILALLLLLARGMPGTASAADWYVATKGTGLGTSWADATNNLQGAITACGSGYTVWVSNGAYISTNIYEVEVDKIFLTIGDGVTVRSKTGLPADVILNGNAAGRVVTMAASSWLIGLTVTNGYTDVALGGGINGGSASNVIITGNKSIWRKSGGGGGCNCKIYNSTIRGNSSSGATGGNGGGLIGCIVYNSTISGNTADRGGGGSGCTFYNSIITDNTTVYSAGGGAYCTFYNCTISGNTARDGCGGGGMGCNFINSISWGNNKVDDFKFAGGSEFYSCGAGYIGVGSITNDPLFVGGTNYRLQASSPCIDKGTNYSWMTDSGDVRSKDLDGNKRVWPKNGTVDMGTFESRGH